MGNLMKCLSHKKKGQQGDYADNINTNTAVSIFIIKKYSLYNASVLAIYIKGSSVH